MAKYLIEGVEYDAPETLPIGEIIEAEKTLGFSMEASNTAATAVSLFIARRRQDPDTHAVQVADWVLKVDLIEMERVKEDPPAGGVVTPGDPENSETSGHQPLLGVA